jgi:uncharacterized protein (DUF1015 family)
MALIHPFRGYRYNQDIVGDLNRVVTQPYDKIPLELQKDYYGRSPFSAARITRSTEKNDDPETEYLQAGRLLKEWLEKGVLTQDAAPAVYAYCQDYEVEEEKKVQLGFIALLEVKYSGGGILPHEKTMAEPKMDRLRLMRSIECNEDMIYTLYTDEKLVINRILVEKTASRQPEIEVTDDFGVLHRVWAISDARTVRKIQDAMVPEELFIADGHHRFETSVSFMKECKAQGWRPAGPESFDKRLVACFNSADQGTTILPTHRLVRNLARFTSASLLHKAGQYFEVDQAGSAAELWNRMKNESAGHVFGFYPADARRHYILRLKEEAKVDSLMLSHGEAYRYLDVSILHTLILDRFLGIGEKSLVAQEHVDFARDRDSCLRQVDEGKYQAAFFLNPTTVEQVQRVALLGERMPQKSTDFYPKLLTGLVFMKMLIAKTDSH